MSSIFRCVSSVQSQSGPGAGKWTNRIRGGVDEVDTAEQAAAQEAFRARYRALRLLLSANGKALGLMAEMEEAAAIGRPIDIAFVRGRCTSVGVSVYQMIRQLNVLAEGPVLARRPRLPVSPARWVS